ncbi:MAG: DUF6320 domain-containing protein [Ruthenibacterium lactatiformans]
MVDHRGDGFAYAWAVVPRREPRRQRGGQGAHAGGGGSALAVLVDFETGYRGWGVSFCGARVHLRGHRGGGGAGDVQPHQLGGYVLYQAVPAVFGLAMPGCTSLAGDSLLGAVVPSILAVATLAGMAVFGDRTIKNEFRRRLHF